MKPILAHLEREKGRALTLAELVTRIAVDSQLWLADNNRRVGVALVAGVSSEPSELEELRKQVQDLKAFVATGKPYQQPKSAAGKKGPCISHRFDEEGCTRENCPHSHDPGDKGRFVSAVDAGGKKAGIYFSFTT